MAVERLFLGVAAVAISGAAAVYVLAYPFSPSSMEKVPITVGPASLMVDIADSDSERAQGLSGRESLAEGEGLLFLFDKDDVWAIWMKDMHFPIDIIWADAEGSIITISPDVLPESYPEIFIPVAPARYVLEVPAGYTARQGIVVGDKIVI